MISIVIPAHNEGAVLHATLSGMLDGARADEIEIVVACNGCQDNTVDVARCFGSPVKVVETKVASKIEAINLGDAAASYFPRIYADADVILPINAIRDVVRILSEGSVLAASPSISVDLSGSSILVKAFYQTWIMLPYHRKGRVGSGVYALSKKGRGRFGKFPEVIADDEFVRSLFQEHERAITWDSAFTIKAPATMHALIKVKTRSRLGIYQLHRIFPEFAHNHGGGIRGVLRVLLKTPRIWWAFPAYLLVNIIARWRANCQMDSIDTYKWERDESSRQVVKNMSLDRPVEE